MKAGLFLALSLSLFAQDDTVPLIQHAVQLQQSGAYAEAADAYRAVLKRQPGDIATHVNLGVVLVQLGRFDEAITEYNAADKLLPGDPRIALNLALAFEKSGRIREAQTRFEALHQKVPEDRQVTTLLADCHLQLGDAKRVIELLQPLAAQDPNDLATAYMLGMALMQEHHGDEGQVLLDRILRQGDSAEARFLLGTRMFESADYPAAVTQLASAIALNPKLPRLQSFYGQSLMFTGDADGASQAFRAELSTNPNDYDANLGLGQILTVRKQFPEAHALLNHALLSHPDSIDAKLALAQCLTQSGQYRQARPLAQSAAAARPNSLEAHRTLLSIYTSLHLATNAAAEQKTVHALGEAASAQDPGPKPTELAPDFALPETNTNKQIRLSDFRGKTPVVLVFGSYSCPNFRASADALKSLQQRYQSRAAFLLIYIKEAHPQGSDFQTGRNLRENITLTPAATLAEKQEHATMCTRKLHLPFTALVDGMDGAVEATYNAWPSRVFVIATNGHIAFSSRLTEQDFHPTELESALRRQFH
jgi:tetratricopeptide (TPR) repeat protein